MYRRIFCAFLIKFLKTETKAPLDSSIMVNAVGTTDAQRSSVKNGVPYAFDDEVNIQWLISYCWNLMEPS